MRTLILCVAVCGILRAGWSDTENLNPARPPAPGRSTGQRPRGRRGTPGAQPEHRFEVLCLDRKTGRLREAVSGGAKRVLRECGGLGRNAIPAVVRQDNVIFAMSGNQNPNLIAIRMGRAGDRTGSGSVLRTNARGNFGVPPPVVHDNQLYVLGDI
ncbi:MAG TPA: hypothetical protein VL285_21410 [Bryobacteraceae bacterium]|nr:hypothetical protein [Bryobacteraceae bacterium]